MNKANEILRDYANGERNFQSYKNIRGENFQRQNLSKANFRGCDLSGANFCQAILEDTDFSGCDLSGANFSKATLTKANFSRGNLSRANFSKATLATLTKADFSRCNLSGTNFSRATLTNTDFSHCIIHGTNFEGAELTSAKFIGVIAGLQQRWILALTIPIILLIVAAGFFFGLTWRYISLSFDTSNQVNQIAGWITLLITITFCAFSSALGLVGEQGEGKPGTGAGALAFYGAFASIVVGSLFVAMGVEPIMAYTGVAAFAFPASGAFAFVLAVGIAVVGSFKESVALVFSFIFTILIACVVATSDTSTFTVAIGLAGVVMVGLTIFSCYFGHRAINGDLRDAWVRDRAVAFGAKFGTKFFGTVLTKADFTGAIIKNTDLRAESLIHTCFKDAK